MNAIGPHFLQIQRNNLLADHSKEQNTNENLSPFHGLLMSEHAGTDNETTNQQQEKENITEAMGDIDDLLSHMLTGIELAEVKKDVEVNDGAPSELLDYLMEKTIAEVKVDQVLPAEIQASNVLSRQAIQQFISLNQKAEIILSQISTEQDIKQAAPKLIMLLEQWTTLVKKYGEEKANIVKQETRTNEATKAEGIWRELLDTFKKEDQSITKHRYKMDANITSADITKWIQQGLGEKAAGNQSITPMVLPMSQVEQYVIYMTASQTQNSQMVGQQLIEQFQSVIQESRFPTSPSGPSQLSITLRPENLGEMMIRLTQVNGEMTVKIIVTSQATKEMLQSNIHQLKNMFLPHQVIIEKQELNTQSGQETSEQRNEEQSMEDQEQNQHQHDQSEQGGNSHDDFEKQFHELLMNEKV